MRWTGAAILSAVVLSAIVFVAMPAQADLLTFSGDVCSGSSSGTGAFTACANLGYINQAYGDTANVDVIYKDFIGPSASLQWWNAGYNELSGVLYADKHPEMTDGSGDCCAKARIGLAPLGGASVTLNSFNLGSWPDDGMATQVQVLDLLTSAVLFSANPKIGTEGVSSQFFPSVTSFNGLAIEWQNSAYNIGIDNVDFSTWTPPGQPAGILAFTPTATVPEPSTLFLLGAGLTAFVGVRRRRSR